MMRVSTRIALGLPNRSICRSSSTRSNLTLHVLRQVADLVEEDRRVIGQLEAADLTRERASKRALFAAVQLALDQRGGNRRAVHAHHRPAAAALSSWIWVANSSLPVPVSPSSSTVESVAATCRTWSSTRRMAMTLADDDAGAESLLGLAPEVHVFGLQLIAQALDFPQAWLRSVASFSRRARKLPNTVAITRRRWTSSGEPQSFRRIGIETDRPTTLSRDRQRHRDARTRTAQTVVLAVDGVADLIDAGKTHDATGESRFERPGERSFASSVRAVGKSRRAAQPTTGSVSIRRRVDAVERAAIQIERLADPSKGVTNRFVALFGGKFDETDRQLAHQPFEVQLPFDHPAQSIGARPCGDLLHFRSVRDRQLLGSQERSSSSKARASKGFLK